MPFSKKFVAGSLVEPEKRSRFLGLSLFFAFVAAGSLAACGGSSFAKLAREGKFPELGTALKKEPKPNSERELRDLARSVLEFELKAGAEKGSSSFVVSLTGCGSSLRDLLEERAETPDDAGAEAAMLLLELGSYSESKARENLAEVDGGKRALSAYVLHQPDDGDKRRAFFVDPDARVRRAALTAAARAHSEDDREALLEVGRLDPDPLCRSRAYSALALIGGADLAVRLYDRYVSGDEATRFSILDAWASPALFGSGGEGLLERAAYGGDGFEATGYLGLEATSRLRSVAHDETSIERAKTNLQRYAREGTTGERRLALARIPSDDPGSLEILREAAKSEDEKLAVIAAARLLAVPAEAKSARERLLQLGAPKGAVGREARAALAASGDSAVQPLLEKELASPDPSARLSAGRSLLRLDQPSLTAPLLADANQDVRSTMACSLLVHLR